VFLNLAVQVLQGKGTTLVLLSGNIRANVLQQAAQERVVVPETSTTQTLRLAVLVRHLLLRVQA
jgi:hypothetical protein